MILYINTEDHKNELDSREESKKKCIFPDKNSQKLWLKIAILNV